MRPLLIFATTAIVASTLVLARQSPVSVAQSDGASKPLPPSDQTFPHHGVIDPIIRPHDDDNLDRLKVDPSHGHSLADLLTRFRKAAVWWEYARDVAGVAARLQSTGLEGTTILVPLNDAMQRLSRKPHQNPDGSEDDTKVKSNVDRFISAHVIPELVKLPTKGEVATLLPGTSVQIVKQGDGWIVKPGDIPVDSTAEVRNGLIVFMDGVIEVN